MTCEREIEKEMEDQSQFTTYVHLEDKVVAIWPDYPNLCGITSPEFKTRDLREKAFPEISFQKRVY